MGWSFGRKQIGNPTPASIGFKITVISVLASAVQMWINSNMAAFIPLKLAAVLGSILSLIIFISNALKPLFGVPIDTKMVDAKDVTAVEDKPETKT